MKVVILSIETTWMFSNKFVSYDYKKSMHNCSIAYHNQSELWETFFEKLKKNF